MYRNHDYFGDGSVQDTWRQLTIFEVVSRYANFFFKYTCVKKNFIGRIKSRVQLQARGRFILILVYGLYLLLKTLLRN